MTSSPPTAPPPRPSVRKLALEWVMERQSVSTDKDSGITNDANLWATETMGNAKYPLELFLRVVTVSLETNRIVAGLPGLGIAPANQSEETESMIVDGGPGEP